MKRLRHCRAACLGTPERRHGKGGRRRVPSLSSFLGSLFSLLLLVSVHVPVPASCDTPSVSELDAVTVEEAEEPTVEPRRLYVPRPSNPDYGREAPKIAGAPLILADDWPYIFDGVAPEAASPASPSSASKDPRAAGETRDETESEPNSCALFVWAHTLSPRPTLLVRDKEPVEWSELWHYFLRELQRRGEFDTLVLLAPDAHNRQDGGIRRLHTYAAWLARKARLLLARLLVNGAQTPPSDGEDGKAGPRQGRPAGEKKRPAPEPAAAKVPGADAAEGRGTGNPGASTKPATLSVHAAAPAAKADGPKREGRRPAVGEGAETLQATLEASPVPPEGASKAANREKGEATPEDGLTAAEREWLSPFTKPTWRRCSEVHLFLLGKGVGGLALRLMAAPSEDLWAPASAEEEQEMLRFHAFLGSHAAGLSRGSAGSARVALRSVVTVNTLNAGSAGRPFPRKNPLTEAFLWNAPVAARLTPGSMLSALLGAGFLKELMHGDADRLLCNLAQQEKHTYAHRDRTGSLLSRTDAVLFYGHLDDKARLAPASVLGIWDPVLLDSVGVEVLARSPEEQNHYRFIDVAQSPSNLLGVDAPGRDAGRRAWTRESDAVLDAPQNTAGGSERAPGGGGRDAADRPSGRRSRAAQPWTDHQRPVIPRFQKSLLVFDRNVCKVLPRKKLYEATLQLLELVNEHQQPAPFVPLRFGRLTNYATLFVQGEKIKRRGAFYLGRRRVNFDVNKWCLLHAAVRSLQTRAAIEATEFDNDKSVPPQDWYLPADDKKTKWT
ncbi:conserved hypothetical protein [Neospora caninum Liverpool]|uniref:Transmembrane protein n=1 Tax=Neospora caninum (strain Liverpool) TaxID=572307 RepID=F0VF12_NEOCL|nr:conserved hypothetical protein [Neospora caninum Liverpool]CBZ52306.1 conserved hypothetical protein [Neospora caninum Liverpool]CEL66275.1 TPA: hypothetical protein BN1204_020930 [Neospora caninum Liverpool]|eukprot:XP_003882338.1 conserved hypothetical protein [Neospora caninum Liverpool]